MNDPLQARGRPTALKAGLVLAALAAVALAAVAGTAALPAARPAQVEPKGEIAATLAAGRVVFCVTGDAILVAGVEGGGEPGSLPPAIVPATSDRIAVILGADEWIHPGSGGKPMRVDAELSGVAAKALRGRGQPNLANPDEPTEIEDIGIAVLELLRPEVDQIHSHLGLRREEPLVELLLADYAPGYGPEVWSLQYRIRQESLGNDYWQTRILRPAYYQLYPPEKGQPHTLIEVRYPTGSREPTLLEQLEGHAPQLERIAGTSKDVAHAIEEIRKGDSRKAHAAAVADFLRAALPALAGNQARMAIAQIDERRGFQWLLAPQQPPPAPSQQKPQEPGAPSLRKYTPPKQQ